MATQFEDKLSGKKVKTDEGVSVTFIKFTSYLGLDMEGGNSQPQALILNNDGTVGEIDISIIRFNPKDLE